MQKISSMLPKVLLILSSLSMILIEQQIYPQQLLNNKVVTDNSVYAIEVANDILYIGGAFNYIGPSVQNITMFNITTNQVNLSLPHTDKAINTIIPDGSGGWYIGGYFTKVGDSLRGGIAHILSDFSVDSWNPSTDGFVNTILLHNGVIYFGGSFSTVMGSSRSNLAAVDTNGNLLSWNPSADLTVNKIATDGSVIYAGGSFTSIGGQSRNYIAAIDISTGNVTSWNPNPDNYVTAIEINDTIIYIGGGFTTVSGQTRNSAAAIGSSGVLLNNWIVNVTGGSYGTSVNCIKKYGSVIYLGGNFTLINGYSRSYAGAVDINGNLSGWAPTLDKYVYDIIPLSGSVLIAGDFTAVNSQERLGVVQVDDTTGSTVMPFNAGLAVKPGTWPSGYTTPRVKGMSLQNDNLYLVGVMDITAGKKRTNIAAIDLNTDEILDWNPLIAGGNVYGIKQYKGVVYLGGTFTSVNGNPRNKLAAVNFPNGDLLSWDPYPNNSVYTITAIDSVIYIGGTFTTLGNGTVTRNRLAAISESGTIMGWDPNASSTILSLVPRDSVIYIGGYFTTISGESRGRIAAVTTSGNLLAWNPNAGGGVSTIAISDTIFYIGGAFNSVGGQTRKKLAAVGISGNLLDWIFDASSTVNRLKIIGNNLYVGGNFTTINGITRQRLAAIDLSTNTLRDDWLFNADNAVNDFGIDTARKVLYVGGNFSAINGIRKVNLAAITDPIIPVELTSFIALVQSNDVLLNWSTATETNNKGFEIQRYMQRTGDKEWKTIGYIPGFGTTTEPKSYSFTDKNLLTGIYMYRLKQIDFDGTFKYSSEIEVNINIPATFILEQNYPNPFNPTTTIEFSLPEDVENVRLTIYNILGEKVAELVNGMMKAGRYRYQWDAKNFATGLYIYELKTNKFYSAKKMILMK